MKTEQFRVSALFTCECGLQFEDLDTSRQQAYNHAKSTGHKIHGQIATSYHYN